MPAVAYPLGMLLRCQFHPHSHGPAVEERVPTFTLRVYGLLSSAQSSVHMPAGECIANIGVRDGVGAAMEAQLDSVAAPAELEEQPANGNGAAEPQEAEPVFAAGGAAQLPPHVAKRLWDSVDKPLLRVGKSGVQASHLTSLSELLAAHRLVKVQLNAVNSDVYAVAKQLSEGTGEVFSPLFASQLSVACGCKRS